MSELASVVSSESSMMLVVDMPALLNWSHGLTCWSRVAYKTKQIPLAPARRKLKPRNQAKAAKTRHQRGLVLSVSTMAITNPKMMFRAPRVRPKSTRGGLPLTAAHRMKLGCEWLRRDSVTTVCGIEKAEGWVVC